MSKLMRMKLSGIRSFGPDEGDAQNIRFYTPLTLIQGQNGCGKTTIIEALKFAITGELPGGTDRGQGFLYDPKLAKCFETRGQVKLRVSDSKGRLVTVTKSMCVLQKGNKLEFKRLDSSIARGDKDDPAHASGKCAGIDHEMSLTLGVSKSVLNNVIFCHQEDSNWPLDESKKLKERFDDIFDATRYNKCLESINKYIKKNVENQKLLRLEVSNLNEVKRYVEQKRELLREKEGKLDLINKEIEKVVSEFEPIINRIEELDSLERNYNILYTDVTFKKKELANLKEQQEDILKVIEEFGGSDEELRIKVATFEEDLSSLLSDIKVLETKKQEIEKTENKLRTNINEQNKKLGELQSEKKQNELKIQNRNNLLSRNIKDFAIKSVPVDANTSDYEVKIIIVDLQNKLESNKSDVDNLEKKLETEEKDLQNDIDKFREDRAKLKQNIDSRNKQLSEFKDETRQVQHKLQELDTADDQLKLVDSKLTRLDRELSALEASVDTSALRANIDSEKQKYLKFEDRLALVDSEIQSLQHYTTLQTELDVKKENCINKQNELQKLQNKHEKTFKHIFPDGVPSTDIKSSLGNYQRIQVQRTREMNKKINDKQREVMKLETNLNSQRDKLEELDKELSSNKMEISVHCEDKELDSVVEDMREQLEKLQNQRGVYYSSKYLYQKFITGFQADDPSCPVCKRRVEEKAYATTIIDSLRKKIETFPTELRRIDKELVDGQSKFQKLLGLKPISEKIKKLDIDVPKLRSEVTNLQLYLVVITQELNELKNDISIPQKNEELSNSVMGDAALIDQHQRDLVRIKQDIASITSRIPHSDSSRGMQEALSEQETLKIDIRTGRDLVESQRNKLTQHTERLQKQKEQRNDLISRKLNIRKSLQDKDHLVSKREELEIKIGELESEYQDLLIQVEPMKKKLQDASNNKDEQKILNRNKIEQGRAKYNELKKNLDGVITMQSDIDLFNRKNVAKQIESVNESVSAFKNDLTVHSEKKTSIDNSVDELKKQVRNRNAYFRELQDNVKLREKKKKFVQLEKDIDALEEKLGSNDIGSIRRQKNKLIEKQESLRKQKHLAQGKRDELNVSISELRKELLKPQNVKSAFNFKKKFLELMLHERAVVDLKEFIRGMDWAMMQFHKQRMIQINNIMKELWRSIYKGNDCDYIEIKTDDSAPVGLDKRKVYKYRVVQVKSGIELDMRGRCSAGQRVLASLIVRIALADTFSTNCGILALDEPTTNLDRENIHSLSEALVDLVSQKKQQKNFQLLVITHDQEFVDTLTRVDSLDNYYVIKRNAAGKSTISLHNR